MAKKRIISLAAGHCMFCGKKLPSSRFQDWDSEDVEADGTYRQALKDIYCPACGVSYTEWHKVSYTLVQIQCGDNWYEVDELHIGAELELEEEEY